nr:esterase FE4-like [Vanessa tameamea]
MDKIIGIFILISVSVLVLADIEVETTHGRVAGRDFKSIFEEKKYHGFMGIPFAAPPVKDLRFKAPQPMEPWTDVLQATKVKPACVQFNTNFRKGQALGQYGLEDCLYLDIFTPAVDENKRPVVVFLYSERLKNSYNKTKDYAPDFFIEEDLVVVTISHRLAIFGFLSFEDNSLPGNAGLKDIVAALDWISNNINNFGGDPEKVTLLGAQGGAVAVDFLIRSKAKKYFRSAILQSGTSLNPAYLQGNARERFFELANLLEITSSSSSHILKELNEIPVSKLFNVELRASPPDYFKETQRSILSFGPIVEKDADGLITEYPENSYENINIPIMVGYNSREGLTASYKYLAQPHSLKFVEKDFPFLMPLRMKFRFDPLSEMYYDAIDDIKKFYFKEGKVTIKSTSEYVTYVGDLHSYSMDMTAKMYANISLSPVYYYHFDFYSDLNENKNDLLALSVVEEGTWGAATGDELCYLFRCPSLKDKYAKHKRLESQELIMQKKMIKLWANFVKYGNPTPKNNNPLNEIEWSPYNLKTKEYLLIGNKFEVKKDLWERKFTFWDDFLNKWEKRSHKGVISEIGNKKDEL